MPRQCCADQPFEAALGGVGAHGSFQLYPHRIHWLGKILQTVKRIMKVETEIKKWGNSLALRVTGVMAEMPGFKEGAKVIVDVSTDGFEVKPVLKPGAKIKLPYSEQELLKNLTPETAHAEALAMPMDHVPFGDS